MTTDSLLVLLLVGLVAGFLASHLVAGHGYGLLGDIVVGIIGAFLGGPRFGVLMPGSSVGFLGSIVVAFIGAILLIAVLRTLSGRSRCFGSMWRH